MSPHIEEGLCLGDGPVEDGNSITCFHQMSAHRPAHHAGPNPTDAGFGRRNGFGDGSGGHGAAEMGDNSLGGKGDCGGLGTKVCE